MQAADGQRVDGLAGCKNASAGNGLPAGTQRRPRFFERSKRFEILGTNIKKWSAGSPAQSAIDALLHLMETKGLAARNIKAVKAR